MKALKEENMILEEELNSYFQWCMQSQRQLEQHDIIQSTSVLIPTPQQGITASLCSQIKYTQNQAMEWVPTYHSKSMLLKLAQPTIVASIAIHCFNPNPPKPKPQFSPPKNPIWPYATIAHMDQAIQGLSLPVFQPIRCNANAYKKHAESKEGFFEYTKIWHFEFQTLVFKTIKSNLPKNLTFPPKSVLLPWFHTTFKHYFFVPPGKDNG